MSNVDQDSLRIDEICSTIESKSEYLGNALIISAIASKDGQHQLHSALVTFLERNESASDEKWDYGELCLLRKQLSLEDACRLLRELGEEHKFKVDNISLEVECSISRLDFVPSKKPHGYPKAHDWPTEYAEWPERASTVSLPHEPLVSEDLPFYPDGRKAVMDFMKISNVQQSVFIQIPDYRARIKYLGIAGNRIKLEVESNIDIRDLSARFYGEYIEGSEYRRSTRVEHSRRMDFESNSVEFEFKGEPDYVSVVVFDRRTGGKIDYREYHYEWASQEGVTIELEQLDFREIIRRGEDVKTEFKLDLKSANEFLETVVAFANMIGGLIFVGVSDDPRISGFEAKSKDQISNLIAGNVEPIVEFQERQVRMDDRPITIVEVPEGENKPYSHRELGVFVRRGGTDRHATRTDLDEIYEERKQYPYSGI